MTIPVILASSSPRRRELLGLLGIEPEVVPANIPEIHQPGELPVDYVERLARAKAAAVDRPEALVIAADTTVAIDGELLEKPADAPDAIRMLTRLSGRDHVVHTAMAVRWQGREAAAVETTRVWFRQLSDQEIIDYVATGEPMDKAGAYGIQGYGAVIVKRIEGDYFTVMGLGLTRLVSLWNQLGLTYRFESGFSPVP